MFKKAHIKLTIFYSILFFLLFWSFSVGIYIWMERSFGEGYISRVKQEQQTQTGQHEGEYDDQKTAIVTVAGDVALSQLQTILLVMNGSFLLIIPIVSYFLARYTLRPIQETHEKQKQFVSDASHELRTPLAIMNGEIDVHLKKDRSIEEYRRVLTSIREENVRLAGLVENLLYLARSDQDTTIEKQPVDLTDVINTARVKLDAKIKEKKLRVELSPPHEEITVHGQEALLSQLFFNVLDNAIKYSHKKGRITVRLEKTKDFADVTVRDTGIGMTEAEQAKIFNRFYRVDSSRTQTKGYGLGLAIAKSIVEKHHGKIFLTSKIHRGTTFHIQLPLDL